MYGVGTSMTRPATIEPGHSGRFIMMIQPNSRCARTALAWMARAITVSMIWYRMSCMAVASASGGRARNGR
jgi:hypothetical protein